jgi:putative Ca2+/H+ antiporter (TMEM165/GDT1 family)
VPGLGTFRRVTAVGMAEIDDKRWIVSMAFAPMTGTWSTGQFAWIARAQLDFYSARISMIPEGESDEIMTFFADGTGGSTIILGVDDGTVTGVFSGNMVEAQSVKAYGISSGRFEFDLP